jgi:guanylate kinase
VESAEVFQSGHLYGTLKSEIVRAGKLGAWAVLEIDVQGALNVMSRYSDAITFFLKASSEEEYERRLRGRGTESEAVIQRRLDTAHRELKMADRYQYQIVNDDLDRAVDEIVTILSSREPN